MSIELLLSRLTKVRGRNGNWTACCPAHEDRSPSLAIKDEDGKVVMHCFAGCSVNDIVGAVGMEVADLFPPKAQDYGKADKPPKLFATDLLRVIAREAQIVAIGAFDIGKAKPLSEPDRQRLLLACERINTALEVSNAHQH